jgi:hypothetical protein
MEYRARDACGASPGRRGWAVARNTRQLRGSSRSTQRRSYMHPVTRRADLSPSTLPSPARPPQLLCLIAGGQVLARKALRLQDPGVPRPTTVRVTPLAESPAAAKAAPAPTIASVASGGSASGLESDEDVVADINIEVADGGADGAAPAKRAAAPAGGEVEVEAVHIPVDVEAGEWGRGWMVWCVRATYVCVLLGGLLAPAHLQLGSPSPPAQSGRRSHRKPIAPSPPHATPPPPPPQKKQAPSPARGAWWAPT